MIAFLCFKIVNYGIFTANLHQIKSGLDG